MKRTDRIVKKPKLKTGGNRVKAENPVHQKAAREVFLPLSKKVLFYDFTSE